MIPLVDALRELYAFLPVVLLLVVLWIGYRLESAEERLATTRLDLMHLVELLHKTDTCSVRLRDGLARDWPELRLRQGSGAAVVEPLGERVS